MKKALVITVLFFVFLTLCFLQTNLFSWYNIAGIKPNLFIIFILFIGLFLGKIYGLTLGTIFGLVLDLIIGKRIGLNAIMLGMCGLIGGILDKSFSKDSRITFMLMTIAVTIFGEIVNYTLQILLISAEPAFIQFMKIVIIEAIFNAILVIILYPLIQKAGDKTEEIINESKSLMRYY